VGTSAVCRQTAGVAVGNAGAAGKWALPVKFHCNENIGARPNGSCSREDSQVIVAQMTEGGGELKLKIESILRSGSFDKVLVKKD